MRWASYAEARTPEEEEENEEEEALCQAQSSSACGGCVRARGAQGDLGRGEGGHQLASCTT